MARFNNTGIGLASSITDAPRPPIEIVAEAVGKAGYSLTGEDGDAASTEVDVTLVQGQALTLVNGGGFGYTDGTYSNRTEGVGGNAYTAAINQQTAQPAVTGGGLTITFIVQDRQVVSCVVGNNSGSGLASGDTYTINGSSGDNAVPAIFMIP